MPRTELTFDGFGINGPDEYRSRIATFAKPNESDHYGRLFAAAPELLECLIDLASGHSMIGEAKARAAIAKATGGMPCNAN